MTIFFLSGALFPLNGISKVLDWIALFNPLSYGIGGLRDLLTSLGSASLFTDFAVLSILTLALFALGSWLFSKIEA